MRSSTRTRSPSSQRLMKSLTIFLVAIISACGTGNFGPDSSTKPMSCTSATCGTAVVTMTDAAGAFLAYQVTVVSLQLKKSDGTLVDTLPVATRVDFAKLVNLTEVVSAGQVPAGEYSGASVTLDYTGSTIIVDDGSANGVQVSPVDSTGAPLGKLTLTVQLDTKHQLEITTGNAARLAFDFNLLASNTVDVTKKTVTVKPVLVASVVAPDEKEMRVRGTLVTVDTVNKAYTVNVQPFDDEDSSSKGQAVVHVTDTTTYEIDSVPFTGPDGLMKLSTVAIGTMTVAFGTLSPTDQSFLATRVLSGTSVQSSTTDHVSGIVVARVGTSLTLRSGEWEDRNGNDDVAPGDVTVTLADTTTVTAEDEGSTGPTHTIADISVGSRIDAFGVATKDSAGHVTLDATKGHVRLENTHITGSVVSAGTGTLTLQLKAIDGRDVSLFTFAGTGSKTGHDSDPTMYVVNTGSLALGTLMAGASTNLIGFVAPFAGAPPDFNAEALESSADTHAELSIDWTEHGSAAPFKALDDMHLDLDISNPGIGEHHQIEVGDHAIDLKGLLTDPSIKPDTLAASTLFSIAHATNNTVEDFHSFVDFSAKLKTALNGTVVAFGMVAEGQYDATANVFTARHLIVRLSD
jgi:hypothetical protein